MIRLDVIGQRNKEYHQLPRVRYQRTKNANEKKGRLFVEEKDDKHTYRSGMVLEEGEQVTAEQVASCTDEEHATHCCDACEGGQSAATMFICENALSCGRAFHRKCLAAYYPEGQVPHLDEGSLWQCPMCDYWDAVASQPELSSQQD